MKSYLKTQLFDASSSSTVSQKQKRVFVFKLFLCNPFARSAGIFLLRLLRLQFTPFTVYSVQGYTVFKFYPLSLRYRDPAASPLNARQYMFENQGYTVLKSVFSSTVSQMQSGLLCSSFSCVTLLREALVYFYSVNSSGLHTFFQGSGLHSSGLHSF